MKLLGESQADFGGLFGIFFCLDFRQMTNHIYSDIFSKKTRCLQITSRFVKSFTLDHLNQFFQNLLL